MNKLKKVGLIIFYILIWLLFILNLAYVEATFAAMKKGLINWKAEWFMVLVILILPFLLGYLLRNHFKVLGRLIVRFFKGIPKIIMECLLFIKNYKLTLPATILLSCIILSGFFFATQVIKQRSIEKQEETKMEQTKKEYVVKRKKDCYDIYLQERKNWNNVKDFSYGEVRDVCLVKYALDTPKKTAEQCGEIIKGIVRLKEESRNRLFDSYFNCLENLFSKEF